MASTITVQNLIDWAREHTRLAPLVGVLNANDPGLQIANNVLQKVLSHPYRWKFNRASITPVDTTENTETYTIVGTDMGYLDRAYAEYKASGSTPKDIRDLIIAHDLPHTDQKGDPEAIALSSWSGADTILRVYPVPGAVVWTLNVDYQLKPTILTALNNTFTPVPDNMGRALRQLFLAEAYRFVEDRRADIEMQKAEAILDEYRKVYDAEAPMAPMFLPDRGLLFG